MRALCVFILLIASAAFAADAAAAPAAAPQFSATASYKLDIPALPLRDALQKLADATSVQIVFGSQDAFGVHTNEVKGEMPVDAALARMLTGTGLTYRLDDFSGRVVIQQRLSSTLRPKKSH